MPKLLVSRTQGAYAGFEDTYTDDLELCVLAVTAELLESLRRMESIALAIQDQNADLDVVTFSLSANWYDEGGVALVEECDGDVLYDGHAVIEIGDSDPFDGLEPQRTELERVVVRPMQGYEGHRCYGIGERFCEFTLCCYRKNGNAEISSHAFSLRGLEAPEHLVNQAQPHSD